MAESAHHDSFGNGANPNSNNTVCRNTTASGGTNPTPTVVAFSGTINIHLDDPDLNIQPGFADPNVPTHTANQNPSPAGATDPPHSRPLNQGDLIKAISHAIDALPAPSTTPHATAIAAITYDIHLVVVPLPPPPADAAPHQVWQLQQTHQSQDAWQLQQCHQSQHAWHLQQYHQWQHAWHLQQHQPSQQQAWQRQLQQQYQLSQPDYRGQQPLEAPSINPLVAAAARPALLRRWHSMPNGSLGYRCESCGAVTEFAPMTG